MKIIEKNMDFQINEPTAIAIGKFDGLHRGHQKLIKEIKKRKENGEKATIITFDPPWAEYFAKKRGIEYKEKELVTKEEKRALLEEEGIDILIEFPMNDDTSSIEAEDFVTDFLIKKVNASFICAGTDLSFGYKGKGNSQLLGEMSKKLGFEMMIIDKILYKEREISSTMVREALGDGRIRLTAELLGRPYSFTGIVQHGNKDGRKLGMPTMNLIPQDNKLLPPFGVYFTEAVYENKTYKALTNIGVKPSIGENEQKGVETFLYDFDEDAYGKRITVKLLEFYRPEVKFNSRKELAEKMQEDWIEGKRYHGLQ